MFDIENLRFLDLSENYISTPQLLNYLNHLVNVRLRHLLLRYNQLTHLPSSMFSHFHHLVTLDLLGNALVVLKMNTFSGLNSMAILNLQHLSIVHVYKCALCGIGHFVHGLNISYNQISSLNGHSLLEICDQLTWLDISNNALVYVEPNMFQDILANVLVKSTDDNICCFTASDVATLCRTNQRYKQCPSMFPKNGIRSILTVLSVSIIILNLLAITLHGRLCRHQSHPLLMQMLSVCDIIYGLYFGMLLLTDETYDQQFIFHFMAWARGRICAVFQGLLSTVFPLTRWITAIISVNQLLVTKYALKARPLSFFKITLIMLIGILVSVGFTVIDQLQVDTTSDLQIIRYRCLPLSCHKYMLYFYFAFTGMLQIVMLFCHATVMQYLRQSSKRLGIKRKEQHRRILSRMLILDSTSVVQWLIICGLLIARKNCTLTDEAEIAMIISFSTTAMLHPICYTIMTSAVVDKWRSLRCF